LGYICRYLRVLPLPTSCITGRPSAFRHIQSDWQPRNCRSRLAMSAS